MGRRYASIKRKKGNDLIFISTEDDCFFGVKENGGVKHMGRELYQDHEYPSWAWEWKDISALACQGIRLMGLKRDGTVIADWSDGDYSAILQWKDIAYIDWGHNFSIGLTKDGRVLTAGKSFGETEGWTDIAGVAAVDHIVGLRKDGTVAAAGDNTWGQCDVSDWKDIVTIALGDCHTVGLKSDGTVVAVGQNGQEEGSGGKCDVGEWTDIVDILAEKNYTLGIKSDGTVVTAGECYDLSGWRDIADINISGDIIAGIKTDGSIVLAGRDAEAFTGYEDWRDIVAVRCGWRGLLGLKSDGTGESVIRYPSKPGTTYLYTDRYRTDDLPRDVKTFWHHITVSGEDEQGDGKGGNA